MPLFVFCLLVIIAALLVIVVAEQRKIKGMTETHWHEWQVRGAHQMYRVDTVHGINVTPIDEGSPITEVLYRCADCEEVATETLEGHWTFEQLSGSPKEPVSTQALLDRHKDELLGILAQDSLSASGTSGSYVRAIQRGREIAKAEGADSSLLAVKTHIDVLRKAQNESRRRSDENAGGDNPDEAKGDGNN